MNHLSLFSGIGGIDLAAHWAGMTTVAFCERDAYCQRVLAKHWPSVPIINDIHHVTKQSLSELGVERIDIISGGFPCQPYSFAGKRRGNEDDRALWPQMLRVISEVRPRWVIGENVAGIIGMALDGVLASLEAEGYEARAVLLPACAVGAWHIRQRVFIVAHADCQQHESNAHAEQWQATKNVCHTDGERCKEFDTSTFGRESQFPAWRPDSRGSQWATEPKVGRVVAGISRRVDRLRALGNAVVPQQVYPILAEIARMEAQS